MLTTCIDCKKKFNKKIRYCPHCGSENKKEAVNIMLVCPSCDCQLETSEYRGSTIDICPSCNGLWLDTHEFKFHTSERDTFTDKSIPVAYSKTSFPQKSAYKKCVHCNALMTRKNFRKISGVLIDICHDHGIWLDAGELEQIRCFIANGGLNESQDKEIASNKIAITKVAGQTGDLKTFLKVINKWNIKRILLQGF